MARFTSAAPLYFTAKEGYLDGGLLSDNPSEDALTAIQQFYRKKKLQLPISLVASLGSGINPVKLDKSVNITTEVWNLPFQALPFMKLLGEAVSFCILCFTLKRIYRSTLECSLQPTSFA